MANLSARFKTGLSVIGQAQGQAGQIFQLSPEPLKALSKAASTWANDQIPFATALALTRLAQRVQREEQAWMKSGFDKGATPFTLNSLFLKAAKKQALEKGARVWFKDYASKGTAAAEYLRPQVFGGQRERKRGEKAMRSRAKYKGLGYLVPGKRARLDSFGNIRGSTIQKVLANIGGHRDTATDTSDKAKQTYFFGTPNGSSVQGVWQRTPYRKSKKAGGLRPFQIEVPGVEYREKFPFFEISDRIVSRWYDYEMRQALDHAIRTRKP